MSAPLFTLAFLEPGHFHAALTLRERHPLLAEEVLVYARPGPELDAFLSLVQAFNRRVEHPTAWRPAVYRGEDARARLLADGRADAVVLAGRNDSKMADIRRLHEAGLPVLGDKPWVTGPHCLPHLEAATAGAPLAMDLMTSRYELTTGLLKRLVAEPEVFGTFREETGGEPAIVMDSVHHLHKTVNGVPLVRPIWYFDVRVQGDGIVDVPTHLADVAQWLVGGGPWDFARDVRLDSARVWDTPVPQERFAGITGAETFPPDLAPWVREGALHLPCNGELSARLRGVPVRLRSEWHLEAPPGGGDTKHVVLRGTRADVTVEHGPRTGFQPRLSVRPRAGERAVAQGLADAVRSWSDDLPGLTVVTEQEGALVLEAPPALRTTHEEHFARVLNVFLRYLRADQWPEELMPDLRCKYTLLATASGLARDSARHAGPDGEA